MLYEYTALHAMVSTSVCWIFFFFFQAEDGIRDVAVTGVQTCALPICSGIRRQVLPSVCACKLAARKYLVQRAHRDWVGLLHLDRKHQHHLADVWYRQQIGRASCRERV